MTDKKKTTKKIIPPVDSRSYVVDSLSQASSSIEKAFNAVNSIDYASASGTIYGSPGQTWDFGHTTNTSSNISSITGSASFANTPNVNTFNQLQAYIPYIDSSNVYPKIDILKNWHGQNKDEIEWNYTVLIYLAGVSKDRVKLNLEKGSYLGSVFYPPKLTVVITSEKTELVEKRDWFLKESKQSFTNRIINLPNDADVFNVSGAEMKDGILSFDLGINRNPEAPAEIVTLKIN